MCGVTMLEGNRVNLRVVEKEDLPLLASWNNDPEFGGEFESLEQSSLRDWEQWYDNPREREKWFIIEKKDGTAVGQILYFPMKRHLQIGYIVVPEERGKGYCTEAVTILVDYIFLSTDVVRIQSETSPDNVASQKVLEKTGFTREGVIRKSVFVRGKWLDGVLYSVLREEWKAKILKG